MSIDSVRARISEIEGRVEGLMQRFQPPTGAAEATRTAPGVASGKSVQPFNVALAAQTGQMSIQPAGAFGPEIEALVHKYSAQNGLDPAVVRAVIRAESDGNPREVSNKGAMGLMQLMPEELRAYGVTNPFDPEQNIMGGTRQLAEKLKIFNGDLRLALAAYNAGTGRVKQYNGVPPYPETQNYVKKIMGMLATR